MVKILPANAGDAGSVPGLEGSSGGDGNPLQYSSLENPIDRGAWGAIVHAVTKSQTRLSMHTPSTIFPHLLFQLEFFVFKVGFL